MTTLDLERDLKRAAQSADGLRTLRQHLQTAVDQGADPELLRARLEAVYKDFSEAGNEVAADLTLDVLDLVTGWCGPGMGIRRAS